MSHNLNKKLIWPRVLTVGLISCVGLVLTSPLSVSAITYGSGEYGQCDYGGPGTSCSITISNNAYDLSLPVSPSSSGSCTIQSDTVSVTTEDPDGYALTLQNSSTSTSLANGANTVSAVSGTPASPAALTDDWGYRVDGLSSFGSGPTNPVTNAAPDNTIKFAATEPSNGTADTIASTSTQNLSAVNTVVWYGICADNSLNEPPGTYSTTILYTASANT